jgi:hypothetical protein
MHSARIGGAVHEFMRFLLQLEILSTKQLRQATFCQSELLSKKVLVVTDCTVGNTSNETVGVMS